MLTYYFDDIWEEGASVRKLYPFNGRVVAQRTVGTNTVIWLHGDHLGGTQITTTSSGALAEGVMYGPWGSTQQWGITGTKLNYTGQRLDGTGLLFYNARYYDPVLGRFVSADTVVPGAGALTVSPSDATAAGLWGKGGAGAANPQELNRYSYVNNNPLRYTDPTGHCIGVLAGADTLLCVGAVVLIGGALIAVATSPNSGMNWGDYDWTDWSIPGLAVETNSDAGNDNSAENQSEGEAPLSVDDYLAGANRVKTDQSREYSKPGDLVDANDDFDALTRGLPPEKIRDLGEGKRMAQLPDGTKIIVRPRSSEGNSASRLRQRPGGYPTVEIQKPNSRPDKVRYVP